jgi:hypothetical protein
MQEREEEGALQGHGGGCAETSGGGGSVGQQGRAGEIGLANRWSCGGRGKQEQRRYGLGYARIYRAHRT